MTDHFTARWDQSTIKAIHGSVRKWIRIAEWKGVDKGSDNCPLCTKFLNVDERDECEGCPVAEATGQSGCMGSPYEQWCASSNQIRELVDPNYIGRDVRQVITPKQQVAAEKEALFLISLLPESEQARYFK